MFRVTAGVQNCGMWKRSVDGAIFPPAASSFAEIFLPGIQIWGCLVDVVEVDSSPWAVKSRSRL